MLLPLPPALKVPFWRVIAALLCGGRPFIAVDNGGVEENVGAENPPLGAAG